MMFRNAAIVVGCLVLLSAIAVGLRLVLSHDTGVKTANDVRADLNDLKARGEAMEREARNERLEDELARTRNEAETERKRAEAYAFLLGYALRENDGDDADELAPPLPPQEMIELANAYLAENPELDGNVVQSIEEMIAKLQATGEEEAHVP